MHRYIFKFGRLIDHVHNIKAHDPTSKILSPTFIAGITNSHRRHKLRWGSSGKTLKEVYADALYQDQLQTLRSVDFPETAPVSHVDINAIDMDTCKKCLKAGHWARNCTATVKGNDHDLDTQYGKTSDSQLSTDIRALTKTLSDIYLSKVNSSEMCPLSKMHKTHLHIRDTVNIHKIILETPMKIPIEVQMHFLIIGPLLHIIDLIHAIKQVVIETLGPLTIQWLMT